jgi:hypothetical protein
MDMLPVPFAAPVYGPRTNEALPVALVEATLALAVTVSAAPTCDCATLALSGSMTIVATPDALVKAVPDEGNIVERTPPVVKVTTVLATGLPLESRTVALAVKGSVSVVASDAAPLASTNVTVTVGAPVAELDEPSGAPPPQLLSANAHNRSSAMRSSLNIG